jgi:hypothetical protein
MKNIHYMWVVIISILYIGINTVWAVDYGTIHSGETRSGEITVPSPTDTFTFYGKADEGIIINMSRVSGELDPKFDLYDCDGILEKSIFYSTRYNYESIALRDYRLKKTCIYTIVCSDYVWGDQPQEIGNYNISMVKIPGPAIWWDDYGGGLIKSGQTRSNELAISGIDAYHVSAIAGDVVIITMSRLSGALDPRIDLYDCDGILEKSAFQDTQYDYQSTTLDNYQLKKTGVYTIICSDYFYKATAWGQPQESGLYNVSLSKIPATSMGLVNPMPADGETAAPLTTNLSWDAVPDATGYDVYFGNEEPLARVAENISGTSYDPPGNLESEKTYLWYVVAHRPDGDFRGPMFIFRTLGAPPSQPEIKPILGIAITVPSTDQDGNPVTYRARWQCTPEGYDILHDRLILVRSVLIDVMEEFDKIGVGQVWDITITPNDGVHDGTPATYTIHVDKRKALWFFY